MKSFYFLIALFISASIFVSCEDDDDFSSSPGLRLSFSTDTLRFDTVFTTFGSSTRRIKVYNRNDNSVTVRSVELMNADKTGFRMNVDGVSGNRVTDVDILKKDSIYMFIEVTVDPVNNNNPLLIRDSIRFDVNGNYQYIYLEAIGQDVHIWTKKTIAQDTILTGEKPFLIFDTLTIDKGATLNIKENVQMYFHGGAGVNLLGTIDARGTIEKPVVFRGDRTDKLFYYLPYDRVPGQWNGITVDSLSFNNHFENFHLRNSTNGILFKQSNLSAKKATFINSIIQNTILDGISAENCDIDAYNSLFANAGGSVVKVIGGRYSFLHCTLANYMSYRGMKRGVTLIMGNKQGENLLPLIQCEFRNSIIAGSNAQEISLQSAEGNILPLDYALEYCLIKATGSDDIKEGEPGILRNNIWIKSANNNTGVPIFKDSEAANKDKILDYYYDFRLDSASLAIDQAYRPYSEPLPYDILGRPRLSGNSPDMGCYEWYPDED